MYMFLDIRLADTWVQFEDVSYSYSTKCNTLHHIPVCTGDPAGYFLMFTEVSNFTEGHKSQYYDMILACTY